jgi:RNA polymerase sigma-70 factor (sigma-E family)
VTFEQFAASRLPALLRYAAVLTGDREQARDLVQDVLTRAYAKWSRIERADRPDAYVHRMVTNAFLNTRRRRSPRLVPLTRRHAEELPDRPAPEPDDDLRTRVWALPRQQRAVLVLRYYEGLADTEIAALLGCSLSTVRSNAARALARLRVALEPAGNLDADRYEEHR